MRLARLTGLEIEKLEAELKELRAIIKDLKGLLASRPRRMEVLKAELEEVARKYGDDRRTQILADQDEFSVEDLIAEEDMVITMSHTGYIKRMAVSTYRRQRRGGRGLQGATTKEEDWIEHLFIASTHDYLMFFTDSGQVYWLKVHEIPQGGRASRGKPVVNCIAIRPNERIAATVAVREFSAEQSLIFATRQGTVKKTSLAEFGNVRSTGIRAINIEEGDELIDVQLCDPSSDIAGHGRRHEHPLPPG
jgi:DNA gyrase subunit A